MKKLVAIFITGMIIGGCSSATTTDSAEQKDQSYQQYVDTLQLSPLRSVKNFQLSRWEVLTEHNVLISSRGEDYLFSLQQRCTGIKDAVSLSINRNKLVAYYSGTSGSVGNPKVLPSNCLIKAIYPLSSAQVTELRHIDAGA